MHKILIGLLVFAPLSGSCSIASTGCNELSVGVAIFFLIIAHGKLRHRVCHTSYPAPRRCLRAISGLCINFSHFVIERPINNGLGTRKSKKKKSCVTFGKSELTRSGTSLRETTFLFHCQEEAGNPLLLFASSSI